MLIVVPKASTLPSVYHGFVFTGSLRPGTLSPWRVVPEHILKPDYADTGTLPKLALAHPILGIPEYEDNYLKKNKNIIVNSASDIEIIRAACNVRSYTHYVSHQLSVDRQESAQHCRCCSKSGNDNRRN